MKKILLILSRSVRCASVLLFCAAVLFLPSSAVGATYTSTVKITQPNTILSGDTISVTSGHGVTAEIRDAGELNNVKISNSGSSGGGVNLKSADLTVTNSDISATGSASKGVYLDNSMINIADSAISTANGTGIYAKNGSDVTVKGGSIKTTAIISSFYGKDYALYGESGSSIEINGTNIEVSGDRVSGVSVKKESTLKLVNSNIDVSGRETNGIWIQRASSADIKDTVVTMRNILGTGVYIKNSSAVQMDNVQVTSYGTGYGVSIIDEWPDPYLPAVPQIIKNSLIKTYGNYSSGVIAVNEGSKVSVIDTNIETAGESAFGVHSYGDTSHLEMKGGSLTTTGKGASAGYATTGGFLTLDST